MNDIKYSNEKFQFAYRVSALIFNADKSKILLFYGDDREFYMLPGGKVHELEKSEDAIRREIKEEIGYENLQFDLVGISEEIVNDNGYNIHQITLTYKCIYNGEVIEPSFKSIESDWINFKWVNVNELDKYKIHPENISIMLENSNLISHIIEYQM